MTITRRAAIFGTIASSTALVLAAPTVAVEPELPAGWVDHAPRARMDQYAYSEGASEFGIARFELLAERHRQAEARLLDAAEDDDAAFDAAEIALMAICSYRPFAHADERARAAYLLEWLDPTHRRGNELGREHQIALAESMGQYQSQFLARAAG